MSGTAVIHHHDDEQNGVEVGFLGQSGWAGIRHSNLRGTSAYALQQQASGNTTRINAGQRVDLYIGIPNASP